MDSFGIQNNLHLKRNPCKSNLLPYSSVFHLFVVPLYHKCITTEKAGVTTQILYFEQKKCWSPIPSEFSFYKEQLDLYILKRNDLFAGMDKAGNFVIAPSFSSLEIFRNVIIGTYNGKKGALSRTKTITSSFYAPILPFVYDDIKIRTACGTLSYLIIVKKWFTRNILYRR